jgi:hypothetical protein
MENPQSETSQYDTEFGNLHPRRRGGMPLCSHVTVLDSQESVEEVAITFQGDAEFFGGRLLAA